MLSDIQNVLQAKQNEVQEWFKSKWKDDTPTLYLSSDIRHSGFKIAIVDTNLFPAGFNNLCNAFSRDTSDAFKFFLETYYPSVRKILIYGEEHTRNKFYLKNLLQLSRLLAETGVEIRVGVMGDFFQDSYLDVTIEENKLRLDKIQREENRIVCGDFEPDLIISNNDFASGFPLIFKDIKQEITPSPSLGWDKRNKSDHFKALQEISDEFAKTFQLDPWQISAYYDVAAQVNLSDEKSLELLASKTESLLDKIRKKYREYKITETPYVYLKNNRGTYGLGLLPVFSGDEILKFNRKQRNKLLTSKGNIPTNEFFIQEGIATADTYSDYPIEPVIYVIGKRDIGGFFRLHESKNEMESLNSPGMAFSCLCLHKLDEPHEEYFLNCQEKENVVKLSRFLARIAALAATKEAKEGK